MKNLAKKFLGEQEREQINSAVQAAEKLTSGEIVCMIQSASYHYPMADVIGATALALPLALVLTPAVGAWLWLGTQNMWIFLSILTAAFVLGHWLVKHTPRLKRVFVSAREITAEVEEAAVTNFFKHGLYRTRDGTGILVFISLFERRVWVLADQGIHAKVGQDQWHSVVAMITEGIRQKQAAASICRAIETIGGVLAQHFPIKPDDTDELDNLIIADT
jgi:putative membrane protein